jgi:MoaE-MoaD fusion protein
MRVQVLYFAVFRERLRRDSEPLDLPDGARVADALDALAELHPPVGALRGRFQVAVNQDMVGTDTVLRDGDELALIPPVAGGTDADAPRPRHALLIDEPPSIDRCAAAVVGPGMGGLVTFTGVVRATNQGHDVNRLEYEAYAAMAEKVFTALCDEIEAELPGTRLAVEHRVGALTVGDIAVVIAAAAPHRAEAFTACRAMIDRLKDRAPIWKKEIGPDGAEWIGLGP